MPTIRSIFEQHCQHLTLDKAFLRKLGQYRIGFANRNEDHIAFFGGNLMGVQTVRFRTEDRNRWFDDILEVDDLALEDDLYRLEAIVPSRQVSADVMNLSCLWLAHALGTSPHLTEAERHEGANHAIMVLQYKFITSILAYWFKYPADHAVAVATYASLSKKFGLKVYGSWGALLQARANDILAPGTIHYKTYREFQDDFAVVYMVNDVQGRIKDILKNIRDVFETIRHNPKAVIGTTQATVSLDGITQIRDKQRHYAQYRRYVHDAVGDRTTWVRDELVSIVTSAMSTMPETHFREVLIYLSLNHGSGGDEDIARLLDDTLTHAFEYLSSQRSLLNNPQDIGGLLARLRALYMASRSSDPIMLELRQLGESIVERSVRIKNPSTIAALRTGLLLYIVLRAFTMHHYVK